MEQIERIGRFETTLDELTAAEAALAEALERFAALRPAVRELEAYYTGEDWRQDLAADEAGLLPAGLKRGVLSEDGVWNALEEERALLRRMLELVGEYV